MAVSVCTPNNIVSISSFETLKIHVLSFLWGLWTLFKEVLKKVIGKSSNSESNDHRRKPPECLSVHFGQHLYVKLKVSKLFKLDKPSLVY